MDFFSQYLSDITFEELNYLRTATESYDDEKKRQFAMMYRSRRRDPMLILACTLLGFFGVAGVQRFMTNQPGMGVLYFFTAGLCFIGTIIDLVNNRQLTLSYNMDVARELELMMR